MAVALLIATGDDLRRHFPGYRLNFKPVSCDAEEGASVWRVIGEDQGLSLDLVGERPPPESQALLSAPTPTSGGCPRNAPWVRSRAADGRGRKGWRQAWGG